MTAGTLVCLLYGSLFNNGVISADYLLYPLLIAWIWSIYRSERLAVEDVLKNRQTIWKMKNK